MTETIPPARKKPRWRHWALEALIFIALLAAIQSGAADKVAETMRRGGYTWPTLPDPEAGVLQRYGFRGVPAFVIIDPSGAIRAASYGYTSEIGLRLRLWWAEHTAS